MRVRSSSHQSQRDKTLSAQAEPRQQRPSSLRTSSGIQEGSRLNGFGAVPVWVFPDIPSGFSRLKTTALVWVLGTKAPGVVWLFPKR